MSNNYFTSHPDQGDVDIKPTEYKYVTQASTVEQQERPTFGQRLSNSNVGSFWFLTM